MVVLLVMIQVFYCTNTHEYTNIPSCRGKLVFDSSRLQEVIFVYTLIKVYKKLTYFDTQAPLFFKFDSYISNGSSTKIYAMILFPF